jgi:hypothetical protein
MLKLVAQLSTMAWITFPTATCLLDRAEEADELPMAMALRCRR